MSVFRTESGVRQGFVLSPLVFACMDTVMKEVKMGEGQSEDFQRRKNGDCLAFFMKMTWYYVVKWKRI